MGYFASIPRSSTTPPASTGATDSRPSCRVFLPIASPGVVVCLVFSFLYGWGDLAYGMTFLLDQTMRPITAGIFNFLGQYGTKWSYLTRVRRRDDRPGGPDLRLHAEVHHQRADEPARSRDRAGEGDAAVAVSALSGRLVRRDDDELLWIEPWGDSGLRVRATCRSGIREDRDWALLPRQKTNPDRHRQRGRGINHLRRHHCARASPGPDLVLQFQGFAPSGRTLAHEIQRGSVLVHRSERPRAAARHRGHVPDHRPVRGPGRERIFGMGQYQDGRLDLKGSTLELAHRNSQASVPFFLSSKGYGFLWNNPAIGRATFAANLTEFVAEQSSAARLLDHRGRHARGHRGALRGRHRHRAHDARLRHGLLAVQAALPDPGGAARRGPRIQGARAAHLRDRLSTSSTGPCRATGSSIRATGRIPRPWSKELAGMGIELMVSIWPTVDKRSENFEEMREAGLLIRVERGIRTTMDFMGNTVFFDATNPRPATYVWDTREEELLRQGHPDLLARRGRAGVHRLRLRQLPLSPRQRPGGRATSIPSGYAQAFYDGMKAEGQKNVINLLRCAWAGSQRYGALVWSGDIDCTFDALRRQLAAGLNMGIAGIPWWTTDIGGFDGGDPDDPAYRELLIRWFQWGAFCPVFRLHGHRIQKPRPAIRKTSTFPAARTRCGATATRRTGYW